jgi:hypothetical protein
MSNPTPDNNIDPVEEGEFVPTPAPVAANGATITADPTPDPTQPQVKIPEPTTTSKPFAPSFNNIDLYKLAELPKPSEASLTVQKNEGEDDEIGVEESKTNLPIYKKSGFKIAIIGGLLFGSITALSRIIFPGEESQKVAVAPDPVTTKKTEDFAPDPRMGVLTSKVAIQDQKNAIAAAQQQQEEQAKANSKSVPTPGTQPTTATTPTPASTVAAVPTPATIPPPPPVVTNNRQATIPVYRPPNGKTIYRRYKNVRPQPIKGSQGEVARSQPAPQPQARIIASSQPILQPQTKIITRSQPAPQPQAKIITRSQPAPQPQAKIITRSQPVTPPPMPQYQPPVPPSWETANSNAVGTWGRTNKMSLAMAPTNPNNPVQASGNPSQPNTNSVGVQSETMNDSPVALVGQQLRAKTIVPYQVASTNKGFQTIVIALGDPLTDTRGNIMLPAGTQVMTDITILDNGLMQITSAKIYRDGRMVDLPKQSLILQNSNKQPLIAQSQEFGGGDIANRDLTTVGVGALQGVGKNLIQSQTQTIVANGATIQSSNGQVNYVGAALDGGLSPVLNQWVARNQTAATQTAATSKLWLLPTGTDVNLIIAQPFSL